MTPAAAEALVKGAEAAVPGIRPGCEKQILWARGGPEKTPLSLVYIHGFSASRQEIDPVPQRVARSAGANLFLTRLTGHGQGGEDMARARLEDWMADMAQAMEIGRAIGERVVLITCSTGGTLAMLAAARPDLAQALAGIVFVSPNFGLANRLSFLLSWPGFARWGPLLLGRERRFEPRNEAHGRFWTTRYPTVAVLPMVAAIAAARRIDPAQITLPALFLYSPQDRVVSAAATGWVLRRWGGPVQAPEQKLGPGDDSNSHVIAGDILSPGRTGPVAREISGWLTTL